MAILAHYLLFVKIPSLAAAPAQAGGTSGQRYDHAHRHDLYLVEGPVKILDADRTAYDIPEQTAIFLCRCGGSGTKPF